MAKHFTLRRLCIYAVPLAAAAKLFSMSTVAEKHISTYDLSLRLIQYRAFPFTRWRISGRRISEIRTNLSTFLVSKGFVRENESLRIAKLVEVYSTGPLVDEGETWFYSMNRWLYGSEAESMLLHWSELQPDRAAAKWKSIMSRLHESDWNAAMTEIILLRAVAFKEAETTGRP